MIHVGIDPGLTGAIAFLDGDRASVYDMPVTQYSATGFVKNCVDAYELSRVLDYNTHSRPTVVFIEKLSAFPGQGVSSMFSLGMSLGVAGGVCGGLLLDTEWVLPKEWKAHFKLTQDKDLSLTLARQWYPSVNLKLAKHHNRAEALLIARYGKERPQ